MADRTEDRPLIIVPGEPHPFDRDERGENGSKDREEEFNIPTRLPLLPIRDIVVFPFMIVPLFVGRDSSIKAVDEALSQDRMIMLATQKDSLVEDPSPADIYSVGTVAMIMRMLKLPDGRIKILVQGLTKARILDYVSTEPFYLVDLEVIREREPEEPTTRDLALSRSVREGLEKIIALGKGIPPDMAMVVNNLNDLGKLADLVASNLGLSPEVAQEILETVDPSKRLEKVAHALMREIELLTVQQQIREEAREEMGRMQREYFLREQLKAIQKELGEGDDRQEEIEEFTKKIKKARMPKEVRKEAEKQLNRLSRMMSDSAEATVVRNYLDWLTELPWRKESKDRLDIERAKEILDEDHYDLEKVKDRILEHLSVMKLRGTKSRGPILCFVGPPGVGKTSLGKSIARAMNRSFVRASLGGLRDEAEIRGHRRTYIGAMPGKIIQGIKQAKTRNPVFMLDEIDKLSSDFRGDPSSALLEALDPEQNNQFVDHYLGVPFDLSKVMFICTANVVHTIPPPLLDRMEVIELPGYTEEDKVEIAKRYLIPRQVEENGLSPYDISFSHGAIVEIIRHYTMEAGLRNLEREISSICRKHARALAEGKKGPFRVTSKNVAKFLGPPKYQPEMDKPSEGDKGVALGLAWTPTGGDVIQIETIVTKGKGKLSLTGQLGDVMKESAMAALDYIRTITDELGLDEDFYYSNDIHIHVPAGAIPKDGPSAGITMAVSIISALTGVPTRKDVAMTGEITLSGRVLPIGGLREKALAAKRMGIKHVIIPQRNLPDLQEMPKEVKREIEFHPVKHLDQVLEIAFEKPPKRKRRARSKKGVQR